VGLLWLKSALGHQLLDGLLVLNEQLSIAAGRLADMHEKALPVTAGNWSQRHT
jgi:hypothetical protein